MKDIYGKDIKNIFGENMKLDDLVVSPIILLKTENLKMESKGVQKRIIEFYNQLGGRVLSFEQDKIKFIHDNDNNIIYPKGRLSVDRPYMYFGNDIQIDGDMFLGLSGRIAILKQNHSSILKLFEKVVYEEPIRKQKSYFKQTSLSSAYVASVYDSEGMMIWPNSIYNK